MTDDERADEPVQSNRSDGDLAAIPDGGLSDTMPDWLRRPPAWRGMVVPEMPEGAQVDDDNLPAASGNDASGEAPEDEAVPPSPAEPKALPEPDRSPIDPSALIELSDLPGWLVGLGQREMPVSTVTLPLADERVASTVVTTPVPDGIALRSQAAEPEPFNDAPAGNGMRILVIVGVIVAVVLVAILIAQFG